MMSVANKTVIVTGAARGIGLAIARRFVEEGAQVVIADIDDKAGKSVAEDLSSVGSVKFIHCNVSERLDVRNLVAKTQDAFGTIDCLINNAAIVHAADFLDISEEDFDKVIKVNLKGSFLLGQAVAQHMVEAIEGGHTPGSIINMSSINAQVALPDQVPYSISKAGISQLTRVMALALSAHGIRVNAIGPGSIQTDMLHSVHDDEKKSALLSRTPLGRFGKPEEIAGVAIFLASNDSSYITGQTLYADGGRLALNTIVHSRSGTD
jgi:glucose 1-dehydrogenase